MSRERFLTSTVLQLGGRSLEVSAWRVASARCSIVLLHEALGSVSYWKDFPDKLAAATGCNVLAYSRAGHGNSDGPIEQRGLEYYRKQVELVLPALLERFEVESPMLYGHSEGAAIALLYAAQHTDVCAVIAECPIVTRENRTLKSVREKAANYKTSGLDQKLARYHTHPDAVFYSWIEGVESCPMHDFSINQSLIEDHLGNVKCPVLVLQGAQDEFGGVLQFRTIQKYLPDAQHEVIARAGHLPYREQTEVVLNKTCLFLQANTDCVSEEIRPVSHIVAKDQKIKPMSED